MDLSVSECMLVIMGFTMLEVQERLPVILPVRLIMLSCYMGIILPIGLSRTLGGLTGVIMDLVTYPKQLIVE